MIKADQTNIIETERLFLSHLSEKDSGFILELLNSPGWLQFIGNSKVKTKEDARDYILNGPVKSYQQNGFGLYLVKIRQDNSLAGICGLIKRDSLDDIDIGFALLPEFEGKGYAYEAASAVIAIEGKSNELKKIAAITNNDNISSIKLLNKLGFRFEKNLTLPGEYKEVMLFLLALS